MKANRDQNIPFCLVAFVTIPISLKLNHKDGLIIEKLKAIDWIGTVLFVSSITGLLIPLTWGNGNPFTVVAQLLTFKQVV